VIRLVLVGAAGRMGRAVAETAGTDPGFQVKAGVDTADRPPGWDPARAWNADLGAVLASGDVVIEFSGPTGAVAAARLCAERGAALVSGATGLDAAQEQALREAAARVAVLRAANFSVGVLALRRGLRALLAAIPGWDVEIVERHHRAKKDSPSGTALGLAGEVREIRGTPASSLRHGREGSVGPRPAAEIGMHAVRGGSWVGDHAVLVAGEGEWIELRHVAQDRTAFARGALAAARFVANASPGFYAFEAILGTNPP
jgi:4-hydroxy-tetrahydrodipicolinate reductase